MSIKKFKNGDLLAESSISSLIGKYIKIIPSQSSGSVVYNIPNAYEAVTVSFDTVGVNTAGEDVFSLNSDGGIMIKRKGRLLIKANLQFLSTSATDQISVYLTINRGGTWNTLKSKYQNCGMQGGIFDVQIDTISAVNANDILYLRFTKNTAGNHSLVQRNTNMELTAIIIE